MRRFALTLVLLLVFLVSIVSFKSVSALPTGPGAVVGTPERYVDIAARPILAWSGNITRTDLTGISITPTWQGYYGNVSGTLTLSDANNYTLYNWSLTNPEGEVYAANDTVNWNNIQCFNFTADQSYASDATNRGATSAYGMNLSGLEAVYGLASDDEDGVDETFSAATNHDLFYTNSLEFAVGECLAVNLYNQTGMSDSAQFQEALLYDPDKRTPVFASVIEQTNVIGFNNEDNDFEMVVLEDGHGTNLATTQYYFYVELGAG